MGFVLLLGLGLSACAVDRTPVAGSASDDVGDLDVRLDVDAADPPDVDAREVSGDAVEGDTDEDAADDAGGDTSEPVCADRDDDGSPGSGLTCDIFADDYDCDDFNPARYPGAPELCNGVDDDCDGEVDEDAENLCGGCGPLPQSPGQSCGECGRVLCEGPDAVLCEDGIGSICGGCEELEGVPGERCGECGTWACTGANSVVCQDPGVNACGGCGKLEHEVGERCGVCNDGTWQCDGTALRCLDAGATTRYHKDGDGDGFGKAGDYQDLCEPARPYTTTVSGDCNDEAANVWPGAAEVCDHLDNDCDREVDEGVTNACGGCEMLAGAPGSGCGTCGQGTWACNGLEAVRCEGTGINACGGCGALDGEPGAACGECGSLVCDGADRVRCADPGANACGGCGALPQPLGASCGTCGTTVCNGRTDVTCQDPGANACGGCASLSSSPGSACGQCGQWQCNGGNQVVCQDPGRNACGGCSTLSPQPGGSCGSCGTRVCEGTDRVICQDPGANACGGCAALSANPGDSCGGCGNYVCDGTNAVVCSGGSSNACGGCVTLNETIGASCGQCGHWACDGPNAVRCDDPGRNACGGCTPLNVGGSCGSCGTRVCDGANATRCDDPGTTRYYHDGDGDGYGSPAYQDLCGPQGSYRVGQAGDCNDSDNSMFPGNPEVCDGKDNDCSGGPDNATGLCATNASCVGGSCQCNYDECFGVCCNAIQICCPDGDVCMREIQCPF